MEAEAEIFNALAACRLRQGLAVIEAEAGDQEGPRSVVLRMQVGEKGSADAIIARMLIHEFATAARGRSDRGMAAAAALGGLEELTLEVSVAAAGAAADGAAAAMAASADRELAVRLSACNPVTHQQLEQTATFFLGFLLFNVHGTKSGEQGQRT